MLRFLNPGPSRETAQAIRQGLSEVGDRQLVVLSDFDHTLSSRYARDRATKLRLPRIGGSLVKAANDVNLVVATGRRAASTTIPWLWRSGLMKPWAPVIVENGGSIAFNHEGQVKFLDLVAPEVAGRLAQIQRRIGKEGVDVPQDQRLTLTLGRTMLLADLHRRTKNSKIVPGHFTSLAEQLSPFVDDPSLRVVDTRNSVTIQGNDVSKSTGFEAYLDIAGISRDSLFVVGMGDGPNDSEIFREADLAIGFSDAVSGMVDIQVGEGSIAAPGVLRAIAAGYAEHSSLARA